MKVTIKVCPATFDMKVVSHKGKFHNIAKAIADVVPVEETFKGKFLFYVLDLTEEQFEAMK